MKNDISMYIYLWGMWMIIPMMVDGISSFFIFLNLYFFKIKKKENKFKRYPMVSIIVPIYNSESTLKKCIKSIVNQNYPKEKIEVLFIDNGSKDSSFEIYQELKTTYFKSKMWWLNSERGKVKALNEGLYLVQGEYIINIDSDGYLHEDAIKSMVIDFENDKDIDALTGVILTDNNLIKKTKNKLLKLLQNCEMFEYAESFLVGRLFESKYNRLFSMAGAFSGFRREAILNTNLYNVDTLGEDTHMTLQIKLLRDGKVKLSNKAYFFTEPIDSFNKLYSQRQRWQIGELEIGALFNSKKIGIKNRSILNLTFIKDHTFLFPRIIWMFGIIYLATTTYSFYTIDIFCVIMYIFYLIIELLNFLVVNKYLKDLLEFKLYYRKMILISTLMPLYRIVLFFIRAVGIINAIDYESNWKRKGFSNELKEIFDYIVLKFTGKKKV